MNIGKLVLLMVISFNLLVFAGCGSGADSETNGNITLTLSSTDQGTGYYKVDATATFSQAVPNFPIHFYWKKKSASDPNGSNPGNSGASGDVSTNNLGIATYTIDVGQTNEAVSFQVEAKSGNVSSGIVGVPIPAAP